MIPVSDWKPTWASLALALLLVWVPLPFASVTPLGLLALRLGVLTVMLVAALTGRRGLVAAGVGVPAAVLLLIAAIGLVQTIPLPRSIVAWVAPERLRLAAESGREAAAGITLSLAPSQSLSTALTFVAVSAGLVVGAHVAGQRHGRKWLFGSVLLAALFQLLYGFRHLAAGSNAVWGLEVGRAGSRLRGTYVNPAHLAPYLEIALAVTFALAWWSMTRLRRERSTLETRLAMLVVPALVWLLLFAGLAFTRSRAGLAAAVLATVAQGVLLAAYSRRWRLLPVGLVAAAAGVGLVAWTGLEQGLSRLLGTSAHSVAANARLEVWRGTAELWRRFPWAGTGLGSFEATFPMVESPELASVSWQHAHNDWLELLSTGGAFALLAAVVGTVVLAWRLWQALNTSHSPQGAAAALAGLGALAAVGLHELLDFGLTLPANALTLAVVVGAGAAGDPAPTQISETAAGLAGPPERKTTSS